MNKYQLRGKHAGNVNDSRLRRQIRLLIWLSTQIRERERNTYFVDYRYSFIYIFCFTLKFQHKQDIRIPPFDELVDPKIQKVWWNIYKWMWNWKT